MRWQPICCSHRDVEGMSDHLSSTGIPEGARGCRGTVDGKEMSIDLCTRINRISGILWAENCEMVLIRVTLNELQELRHLRFQHDLVPYKALLFQEKLFKFGS